MNHNPHPHSQRRAVRRFIGFGAGLVAFGMAATPAGAAYDCLLSAGSVDATVAGGTVQIVGSGLAPNSAVTLTSNCFADVALTSSATGTIAVGVSVSAGASGSCNVAVAGDQSCGTSFGLRSVPTTTTTPTTTPTTPTTTPAEQVAPAPDTTAPAEVLSDGVEPVQPASSDSGKLPFTGVETGALLVFGAVLIGGGSLLVVSVRRRQPVS